LTNKIKSLKNYIVINYIKYIFIALFIFLFFPGSLIILTFEQPDNLTDNENKIKNNQKNNDQIDWIEQILQIGQVIGGIVGGFFGTRYIVSKWQQRKEISEIRRQILNDFQQSFKDYIVMMDTFVAKILFKYYNVYDKHVVLKKYAIKEFLPYGYDINKSPSDKKIELDYEYDGLHNDAKNNIDCLIFKISVVKQKEILEEFDKFEKEFFERRIFITKFLSGLRQYYKDGDSMNKKLNTIWEKGVMYCHLLIHAMVKSGKEDDFIDILKEFNARMEKNFDEIREFDSKLGKGEIEIK
jgi:hypothetical protein